MFDIVLRSNLLNSSRLRTTPLWLAMMLFGCACLGVGYTSPATAAEKRFWTLKPYAIRVLVVADSKSVSSQKLASGVAEHIRRRSEASIGPIWDLSVENLTGSDRLAALRGFTNDQLLTLAQDPDKPCDKLIVVSLVESVAGVAVAAVECDTLLERVGLKQSAPLCELIATSETAFDLLCQTFSPVALFDVDRETGDTASLAFRGSQLPARQGAPRWAKTGAIFQPILRRTDRDGAVVEDGVQPAPWTYLVLDGAEREDEELNAQIHSHTRRPFGIRRRGRVEYYALLLHGGHGSTRVRLHVRDQPETPLSGYQAYLKDGPEAELVLLGGTDADGLVTVEPGEATIPYVFIKSGTQVVAKAPIPVGAIAQVEIPLLDERKRLEAEAKLSLLREELIDLVARRSILASRIEDMINKGKRDDARKLLNKLDGMAGRAQFSQKLIRAEQLAKSDDPQVQQRIDRLFSDTSAVLGAFLSTDDVARLRELLRKSN